MYYLEYKQPGLRVEFANSFSGRETVTVNGQVVSQKSSIMGTDHHFTAYVDGRQSKFTLRTKIGGNTMVMIDLIQDGTYILRNEPVGYGSANERNKIQLQKGLKQLRDFDLASALITFSEGLNTDPEDNMLHFYKACCHSLLEEKEEAMHHLQIAVEHGVDQKLLLSEDALAFIRIQPEFEQFLQKIKPNYQRN